MPRRRSNPSPTVVAVDTGGTFTDFFVFGPEGARSHKVLSTPRDPSLAIVRGLKQLGISVAYSLVHGSTVATNALLERKGARSALLITEGFEDLVEIGRQERPRLYALEPKKTPPLVPAKLRFGVAERVGARGEVLKKLTPSTIKELLRRLRGSPCESLAICLLHAYANPTHERRLEKALRPLGIALSVSSEICPEFREYERASTVCVNAYVAPIMSRYLRRLKKRLPRPLRILQSNGGSLSVAEASRQPVRTLLSGPAGGALGAWRIAEAAGYSKVLTLDMGGTSTDMSLMDGRLEFSSESVLGDFPVKTPMIRIDTIGAGGGSLAWVDAGGALRVGPESAGAEPGPLCYGRGGSSITVTDAHVALGRIPPEYFLGGKMKIFPKKIEAPLAALAKRLKLSPSATAEGILEIANATMARSLRVLSLERGYDPRNFTLLPFGGAGALHAAELAEALQIPRVFIPCYPGLLSAYGMAFADWRRDYVRSVLWNEAQAKPRSLNKVFAELEAMARRHAAAERVRDKDLRFERSLDLRYSGQSFEISLPFRPKYRSDFDAAHRQRYGHAYLELPLEVVNLRLQARASSDLRPPLENFAAPRKSWIAASKHRIYWRGRYRETSVYLREQLPPNEKIAGPAIVAEFSATTFIPPGWNLSVLKGAQLLLTQEEKTLA